MKRLFISVIISGFFLSACVSSSDLVDPNLNRLVPNGTESIGVLTELKPEIAYKKLQRELLKAGFRVEKADSSMLSVSTEGSAVGQSTQARFLFYIEKVDSGSKAVGRAEWMPGSTANAMASAIGGIATESNWEQATWSSGRPKRAMASMIDVMDNLPHSSYSFKNE